MVMVSEGGSIAVTNDGTVDHNLAVEGTDLKTDMLKPGESATLDVGGLEKGDYTLFCEVSGHKGAGMKAMLMVGTSGGGTTAAGNDEAGLRALDPARNVDMTDGTKQFDLTAKIVDWELEPGKTVRAWTYNGQVPGPMIKVDDGDHVRIVLKNDLPQSTALHFHGLETPNSMDAGPRWACTTRTTTR
jgi:hypothetical protein